MLPDRELVEVTDSAVPGGGVEVVNSIPAGVIKIFPAFTGIFDLLYSWRKLTCLFDLYA